MSKEIKIIPGKHCKNDMEIRIVDLKDDDNKIIGWLIYGICKHCKTIMVLSIFEQISKPIQDVDFYIDYSIEAKEHKK